MLKRCFRKKDKSEDRNPMIHMERDVGFVHPLNMTRDQIIAFHKDVRKESHNPDLHDLLCTAIEHNRGVLANVHLHVQSRLMKAKTRSNVLETADRACYMLLDLWDYRHAEPKERFGLVKKFHRNYTSSVSGWNMDPVSEQTISETAQSVTDLMRRYARDTGAIPESDIFDRMWTELMEFLRRSVFSDYLQGGIYMKMISAAYLVYAMEELNLM
jgi:hypothetical protein